MIKIFYGRLSGKEILERLKIVFSYVENLKYCCYHRKIFFRSIRLRITEYHEVKHDISNKCKIHRHDVEYRVALCSRSTNSVQRSWRKKKYNLFLPSWVVTAVTE